MINKTLILETQLLESLCIERWRKQKETHSTASISRKSEIWLSLSTRPTWITRWAGFLLLRRDKMLCLLVTYTMSLDENSPCPTDRVPWDYLIHFKFEELSSMYINAISGLGSLSKVRMSPCPFRWLLASLKTLTKIIPSKDDHLH